MPVVSGFCTLPVTFLNACDTCLFLWKSNVNCLTTGIFMNGSSIDKRCKLAGKPKEKV